MPLYLALRQEQCELHSSEHFGDSTPGAVIRIELADVAGMSAKLKAMNYKNAQPDWQRQPWGGDEMVLFDPAGNKLVFVSPHEERVQLDDSKKADR